MEATVEYYIEGEDVDILRREFCHCRHEIRVAMALFLASMIEPQLSNKTLSEIIEALKKAELM